MGLANDTSSEVETEKQGSSENIKKQRFEPYEGFIPCDVKMLTVAALRAQDRGASHEAASLAGLARSKEPICIRSKNVWQCSAFTALCSLTCCTLRIGRFIGSFAASLLWRCTEVYYLGPVLFGCRPSEDSTEQVG